jgi:hypothetical protein
MILQASEDIREPGLGIYVVELGGLDQRVDGRGAPAAGVAAGEGPVVAADGDAAQRPLGGVVGQAEAAVVEEADQRVPGVETVGDRLGDLVVRRRASVFDATISPSSVAATVGQGVLLRPRPMSRRKRPMRDQCQSTSTCSGRANPSTKRAM